jgi:outer membrane protein assembly factor BamB
MTGTTVAKPKRSLIRRVFTFVWRGLLILVLLLVALYLVGVRLVLDGGGGVHVAMAESPGKLAAEIERHRAAQRAAAPPPSAPAPAAPPVAAAPTASAPTSAAAKSAVDAPAPAGAASDAASAGWTGFRGAARDGHYRERPVRTNWPAQGLTPLWKQPAGGGYASFAIGGGRAFTIEQRAGKEVVAAYDPMTGREVWTTSWDAIFEENLGGDGPRATPAWSDGFVFALGAKGELRCLDDASGKTVWRKNILEDNAATNIDWGMAASPLVIDDVVIVLPGGGNGKSVVAYQRKTGDRVWSALDDKQAYTSPMIATLAGTSQLVVVSTTRMMGLSLGRGELLWSYPWEVMMGMAASQPLLLGDDRVFISSGDGPTAAVVRIEKAGDAFTAREVWQNNRMKNKFTSSVLLDGYIYGLDAGILACMDAATGELKWKGGRYGYGAVILASGHLIVLTEGGDLALVRAAPDAHHEVSRFPVLDGKTWNHPAMADGILLVRNLKQMAAFDLR